MQIKTLLLVLLLIGAITVIAITPMAAFADDDDECDDDIDEIDDDCMHDMVPDGFVIPEVPLGTIMASAAMIIALVAYVAVPKWRRKQTYLNP